MRKFIYALVLLISSLIIIYTTSMSDLECSILMCSNFIIILLLLWATSKVSPALLFFTTFSFLFIGGRFWALILGFDGELWSGTFFDTTFFSSEEKKDTMAYILLFSYLMFIGYNYSYKLNYSHDNYTIEIISRERLNFFFSCALFIIVPVTLFSTAKALLSVMSNGYLALYVSGQNGEYASGSALFDTLQFVLFGLVMTLGSKKNKIRYFVIYLITAFVGVIMGGRGAFGALLMFCIWQLSTRYTFNIKKLLLISSFAVVLLLFVFSFSVRSVDSGNNYESFFELFSNFIYSQGISMAVFNQSRDLTYPILPYIQTFVPGSSTLYSFISGVDLHPYDVSFSQYLSWYLNQTLVLQERWRKTTAKI